MFETWLKAEFGWSRRTAYNFINVYETFAERANLAQIDIQHLPLPISCTVNARMSQ